MLVKICLTVWWCLCAHMCHSHLSGRWFDEALEHSQYVMIDEKEDGTTIRRFEYGLESCLESWGAVRSGNGLGGMLTLLVDGGGILGEIDVDETRIRFENGWVWRRVEPVAVNRNGRVSMFVGHHHVIQKCKHGRFLLNLHDTYVAQSLRKYGEWSEKELEIFLYYVKPGDTVIDVGANIGAFTVPLAKAVKRKGRVISFEPQMFLMQTMATNLMLNELTNVLTFPFVLTNGTETKTSLSFLEIPRFDYFSDANFGGISLTEEGKSRIRIPDDAVSSFQVPMHSIDVMVAPYACPSFIKIDVEGMETDVLLGAKQTIARCKPVLFVENNLIKQTKRLIKLLNEEYRYQLFWVYLPYFNEENYFQDPENIFPNNLHAINLLGLHEDRTELNVPSFAKLIPVQRGKFYFEQYVEELDKLGYKGHLNGQE